MKLSAAVMLPSMRVKFALVAVGVIFLVILGLRPQSLPFIPDSKFSDAVVSHWPAAFRLHQSVIEERTFPSWQYTILGGGPFAANPLNKTAYPLQWLALVFPPALHLNVMIGLHLLLAGWGMWRWARKLGLNDMAAVFSGLAYAFAPKVLAHVGAGHVDLLYALAWWPWLMTAAFDFAHLERPKRPAIIQLGVFAGLLFLSDVRLSLFALTLVTVYGVVEAVRSGRGRSLWRGVPAIIIFVVLTLSVTVPLLYWSPFLSRTEMSASDAGVFSLEAGQLIGLVLPPHSGNPETLTYLSLPVLLLAAIALFSAPRKHALWLGVIVFGALYALGINGPLWPALVNLLPFLLWFRVPSRAWFVVVLVSCLLAGYGLQALMNTVERLRTDGEITRLALKRLAVAGGMGASLFCGGFTLMMLSDLPRTIGIGVIIVGVLLGVALLLGLYGRLPPSRLALVLITVLFVDLAWTGYQWLEWRGPEQWLTHQQALVDALSEDNPARIYSPNYALEQQVAAANGLHLFYGVDPFQLSFIVEAIEQGSGIPVTAYSVVLPPLNLDENEALLEANRDAQPDTAALAEWAVSHVVATYPIDHERLSLYEQVGQYYIYRNLDYDGAAPTGWTRLGFFGRLVVISSQMPPTLLLSALGFVICLILWRFSRE